MRVVLDECLPHPLRQHLLGHRVTTVQHEGWAGLRNGELLRRIAGAGIDAFITVDRNLPSQQALHKLPLGVIVLRARSNKLADLTPMTPQILAALKTLQPGCAIIVP